MTTSSDTAKLTIRPARRPVAAALVALAVLGVAGAVAFWPDSDSDTVQASGGTTIPTAPPTTAAPQTGVALASVDWDAVAYPIDCGSATGIKVHDTFLVTPHPGHLVAVVLASCDAGAGSPPRSIFVYDGATSAIKPRLHQTLAADGLAHFTTRLRVEGSTVVATGSSYSSDSVPRCCPDGTFTSRWTWSGNAYSIVS